MVKITVITEEPIDGMNTLVSRKISNEYTLTTAHPASSYGHPVLVAPNGTPYGADDVLPNGATAYIVVGWAMSKLDNDGQLLAEKFIADHREAASDTFAEIFTS